MPSIPPPPHTPRPSSTWLPRGLMLLLATGVMLQQPRLAGPGAVMVERVDTVIPNTVATPLKGADADVAVIWVSGLEWTPDLDQMKECFDNLET